jgi:asparagine synthase (glutamine-hydrolysing)
MFAFVLYDAERDRYLVARDHVGICPLYTGRDAEGRLYVASEMKALVPVCERVEEFPPGHVLDSRAGAPAPYYAPRWRDYDAVAAAPADPALVRPALEDAVRAQLMSDVPYGVLLSGGLDSSIIAAVAQRYAAGRVEDDGRSGAWWPRLHSFAVGLDGSPDLAAARAAAGHIGTVHHEFHFTVQEGLDALSDVIHHLETYDVTTVRASTPMYLMARRIRATGVKMVLSGEGADEVFGGYLYFHRAPDPRAFHEETVRKLDRLHWFDCLRANKSTAAWGVEARVPFLDQRFLDAADGVDPAAKMAGAAAWRSSSCATPSPTCCPAHRAAAEGAVLRRRGLRLDRRAARARRGAGHRRRARGGRGALSRTTRRPPRRRTTTARSSPSTSRTRRAPRACPAGSRWRAAPPRRSRGTRRWPR